MRVDGPFDDHDLRLHSTGYGLHTRRRLAGVESRPPIDLVRTGRSGAPRGLSPTAASVPLPRRHSAAFPRWWARLPFATAAGAEADGGSGPPIGGSEKLCCAAADSGQGEQAQDEAEMRMNLTCSSGGWRTGRAPIVRRKPTRRANSQGAWVSRRRRRLVRFHRFGRFGRRLRRGSGSGERFVQRVVARGIARGRHDRSCRD